MSDLREESSPLETPEEVIAENENEVQALELEAKEVEAKEGQCQTSQSCGEIVRDPKIVRARSCVDLSPKGGKRKRVLSCGICKLQGHTRKSCPMAAEVEKFKKGRSAPNAYMDGDDYVSDFLHDLLFVLVIVKRNLSSTSVFFRMIMELVMVIGVAVNDK
ncbi:hypothetical protein RIF29_00681 [Crotalaria pallida]|uniref:Uncharacterized protein n=1 Tax=Crotalaria pallida TaxID=3830 RepID=A0AAN9IW32_CROPI